MTFSRWLKLICLTLAALHTVLVAGRFWPEPLHTMRADAVYIGVIFLSLLVVLHGWYRERGSGHGGLGWATLSMFSLLLAEVWMIQYDLPGRETPDSSVADPLYFLSYLTMAAALLRFNGLRGWTFGAWGALLDSLTVVIVAGELAWVSFLGKVMTEPGSSLLRVINLTYVGCDLLLLGLTLLALRRRYSRPMVLFGAGLLAFVAADLLYFTLSMDDRYQPGTFHDSLWVWGTVMQAIGVVWTWRERVWEVPAGASTLSTWRQDQVLMALPYVAMGINCVLLLRGAQPGGGQLRVEYWSVTLFAVVLLRQAVTNRERDVLHRKLLGQARELQHQAMHDPLTGLANRAAFEQALRTRFEKPDKTSVCLALLYLDLNGFKTINDTLGHAAGDLTLQWVAGRLREAAPPGAFVARLGGDEFTVLLSVESPEQAEGVAQRLHACLDAPVPGLARIMQVSASIGVAIMHLGAEQSADAMWQEADQAMYRVKHADRAARESPPAWGHGQSP